MEMEFTEKEQERIEAMIIHLIKKKHMISGGHNGMSEIQFLRIFKSFLGKLTEEKKLIKKPTQLGDSYHLNHLLFANED